MPGLSGFVELFARYGRIWMPSDRRAETLDRDYAQEAGLLILLVTFSSLVIFSYCTFYVIFDQPTMLLITGLSGVALYLCLLVLRFTGSVTATMMSAFIVLELSTFIIAAQTGGVRSPIMWWHTILPLASSLLLGKTFGLSLGILAVAEVVAFSLFEKYVSPIGTLYSEKLHNVVSMYTFITLILTSVFFIYFYQRTRDVFYGYVENIFKCISDALLILNEDGRVKGMNKKMVELLGYGPEEFELIKIEDIIFWDRLEIESFTQLIGNNEIFDAQMEARDRSGNLIPIVATGSVMNTSDGTTLGYILSIKDARDSALIRELKETQSQLVQSGKLAALGEMSSGIAHELNNPLFLIQGFSTRALSAISSLKDAETVKLREYLQNVVENADRMKKIIQHFREFSRQTTNRFEPVDMNHVIYKSFILLNEQLKLRNIRVERVFATERPRILGDENSLEQIFVNLITNARDALLDKFGKEGGVLKVSCHATPTEIVVTIEDNGAGIPSENMEKIFNPFFTTKEVGRGTGLGLSITHSLMKAHKGRITCQSQPGMGTVFTLVFPRCLENAAAS